MQLTPAQLAEMDENGFLVLPSLFDAGELATIRAASAKTVVREGPEVIGEDDDPSIVKMIFGVHAADDVFARLARHPRLVEPAQQILGERVHLFQSRINVKRPFRASGWSWHQDFNQWSRMDGMRTPRALIAGVFIDDVNACNGPLLVIPGSHRLGHFVNETSMEIADSIVEAAADQSGIVPLMGAPGTAILFDCLLIHASAPNITPWTRTIVYLNFTPASQHELQPLREWFHCDANVRPIVPLADDCLVGGQRHRFASTPMPSPRDRELLLDAFDSGEWSGFRAGIGDRDARELCTLPSAAVRDLAPHETRFLGGRYVRQLEALFAARTGCAFAIACNSATSGLAMAAGAIGLGPGDEVLVPCMSFHSTATAMLAFGGVPVFVEVDPETLCIDVADAEAKLTPRARAIVAVHLGGIPAAMERILALARRAGLAVIEDCAQAPGARIAGREVGSFGDAGVFSLVETKSITCGEGGVVVTNDPRIAMKCRLIRNHGEGAAGEDWSEDDLRNVVGMNYRLTELQAAIAVGQFAELDARNRIRNANARHLLDGLRKYRHLTPQRVDDGCEPAYFVLKLRVRGDRDALVAALAAEGIPMVAGYPRLLHQHPLFAKRTSATCPRSVAINRELLWFAHINPPNTRDDMDDVLRAFEKAVPRSSSEFLGVPRVHSAEDPEELRGSRGSFASEGVAFPIRVLDDGTLARFRAEYDRLAAAHGGTLKRFDRAHLFFRWAYDLALHRPIVDAVANILGDDVLVWGSLILSKPPHDDGFVAWHQDGAYAGFLGDAVAVSAWIAFSDSTIESGCMRVIPGSHRQRLAHAVRDDDRNMLSHHQEIAAEVDERQAVDVVLRAGEMSLHHVDIVHGSNANRASWARTGFIVRYTTPAMLRSVTPVLRARGRDITHLDVLREPPAEEFGVSMERYQAAIKRPAPPPPHPS